ncbi:MAG: spore maturation protein [Clostridia bacterium]|nr:spore maturation protein [Clostridia bacterium]
MKFIDYLSSSAMPIIILLIVFYGVLEKNKVFDNFLIGAKEGLEMVVKIFPTLVGLFVAIGSLRTSGIIDLLINFIKPILIILKIPSEIMPLAMLRPISGSASMAVATDIMKKFGVDSKIGLITSTIMGSTETTLYTISIYTGSVGIKKTRFVLCAALTADIVSVIVSVFIWNILEF